MITSTTKIAGAGVLGKRRDGVQIFYRIVDDRAAQMCRAVCMQIAVEFDGDVEVPPSERLAPRGPLS